MVVRACEMDVQHRRCERKGTKRRGRSEGGGIGVSDGRERERALGWHAYRLSLRLPPAVEREGTKRREMTAKWATEGRKGRFVALLPPPPHLPRQQRFKVWGWGTNDKCWSRTFPPAVRRRALITLLRQSRTPISGHFERKHPLFPPRIQNWRDDGRWSSGRAPRAGRSLLRRNVWGRGGGGTQTGYFFSVFASKETTSPPTAPLPHPGRRKTPSIDQRRIIYKTV